MPITVDDLAAHLGQTLPLDTADAVWAGEAVDAVNTYVEALPVLVDNPTIPDPAVGPWPATVNAGAVMLAAHIYQARSAPYGRASLDLGVPSAAYADPEVARLLQLRRHAPPKIG